MCYIASNLSWLEKLSFLTIITLIAPFVVFNYKPFLIFSSPFVQIGYYADCIYIETQLPDLDFYSKTGKLLPVSWILVFVAPPC